MTEKIDTAIIPAQPGYELVTPLVAISGDGTPIDLQYEPIIAWAIDAYWGKPDADGFYDTTPYARRTPIGVAGSLSDGEDYAIKLPGDKVRIAFPYGIQVNSHQEALAEFVELHEREKANKTAA